MKKITTIIFDLSEVLIAGLWGVEKFIAPVIGVPEDRVWPALRGQHFMDLLRGKITETQYWHIVIDRQGWKVTIDFLRSAIRKNFQQSVPGMPALIARLWGKYNLVLLSDHAREWIEYIRSYHLFINVFTPQIYSFNTWIRQTKDEPTTFKKVARILDRPPQQCCFVDDLKINVANAKAAGFIGIQFESVEQLRSRFAKLGIKI